jgi:hypothetical protein
VRSLDPDIARVEREGIAAFDAVLLERLQGELRHRCIAVVRIEYINVLGPKPGTLVHPSGGTDGALLNLRPVAGISPPLSRFPAGVGQGRILGDNAARLYRISANERVQFSAQ